MTNGENPYQGGGGGRYTADINLDAPSAPTGTPAPGAGSGGVTFTLDQGAANQSPPPAGDIINETTTARFTADVIEASKQQPVLVDFWAPWCEPCKQLTPILEKVVTEARGAVRLVKMNIDEHPAIAGQLGIKSIPAVIVFRDGQPVDGFMGAVPESQVRDLVKRLSTAKGGGNEIQEAMAAAAEALASGDTQGAMQIYSAILQQEPDNAEALGALADIFYESGKTDEAKELLGRVADDKTETASVAAVRAKIALADQVAQLGDATELQARLETDPKDHAARYDLALVRNAEGEREKAADHLLSIIRADRAWRDDAARQKLLELFEAWGPADDATLGARRKLSSLLFS